MEVPIVGRARELAELRGALLAATSGSGRLALVSGEAGIGKTRLTAAVAEVAKDYDVPVARGYAVDDPGMPPLWPWRRLARDVPRLGEALSAVAETDGSASARFAMFADATDALADAAASRGLLIILEDMHWADRTSLRLLSHLTVELGRTRMLVVGTFRDAAAGSLAEQLPDLLRANETRSIRLAGLSSRDVARWLRLRDVDDEALAEQVTAKTDGNPLFVRMLVENDLTGHPELHRLVLARVPEAARELLGAASVLGEQIDPRLLTAVSGLDEVRVGELLDVAVKAGVLRSEPEVSFTHALVRDAVYEELAPSQRMALHHRAALALEQSDTCAAGRIANHWRQSGSPDWTVHCIRWARAAAASAVASLAYDEAVKFVALAWQAAGSDGDAELALELARAEFLAGQIGDSLAHCETAARLADGQPDLLARAALVITGMGDTRTLATVDRLCANALRHVPEEATATRARLLAQRAIAVADTCTAADYARALSAEALELAESSGDPDALLDGIHARHITLCAPQYRDERVQLARRACALADTAKQPLAALWGHVWLVDAAFQIGDLAAVDYELNQIEQFATARQHALAWWHLMRLRATRAALIGELEQAAAFNEEAGAFADRLGAEGTRGLYYAFLNQLALLRGTMDRATGEATLALLRTVREVTLARVFIPITHALLGDMAAARATFEEFRHMPRTVQPGLRWAPLVYHIGVVAIMLDDVETADLVHGCLSKLEPDCMNDGSGALFCAGASTRMLGDLSLTCGRIPEAIGHHRHAIDLNARIGARPFLALSRLGLAKALVAQGGPLAEARELATAAAAEFRRLDLPRPLATADTLLATISTAARDANPLSRREAEVAALIGEALSNRQIASRLVLSERTVESHVRSILGKLGFSSRTEIAAWRLREP